MDNIIIHRGCFIHPYNKKFNREWVIKDEGDHLSVELTKNQWALISKEDFHCIKDFMWRVSENNRTKGLNYALTYKDGEEVVSMHRLIAGEPSVEIDHKNGNGLDNRRSNLRLCTRYQQMLNQNKSGGGIRNSGVFTSRYRGVTFRKDIGKFRVRAQSFGGIQTNVGHFSEEEEAARAWDAFMFDQYKEDNPLGLENCNGVKGAPTLEFIRFNFPEELKL